MKVHLRLGDCVDVLKSYPEGSIDAIVCDPPYGISFMNKAWDDKENVAFSPEFWQTVYKVLKPGGTVKAFGGTRMFHRMATAMNRAGFESIKMVAYVYASGFPKSMNIGKALDKMAGAVRGKKKVEYSGNALLRSGGQNTRPWMEEALKKGYHELPDDTPITEASKAWTGWGTALKPAWEPILVGAKPL